MFCSGVSRPISTMPDCSDCITSAPSMAPAIVPMPPASEVPPITAAAIDIELVERAERVGRGVEARRRDRRRDAAPAAPIRMKILTVTQRVLMPASSAASGLPPMAKT